MSFQIWAHSALRDANTFGRCAGHLLVLAHPGKGIILQCRAPEDFAQNGEAGIGKSRLTRGMRGFAGRVHRDARSQRGLFCRWCEAPEIHVRCRGKIGEGRPHCDRLVELLRIDLVERVVCGVMGVEIIESVLAQ